MSRCRLDRILEASRRRPWVGVLALVVLVLHAGCASWAPRGTVQPVAELPPEESPLPRARLTQPTDFGPVRVSGSEFTSALASLVLSLPLRLAASPAPREWPHPVRLVSTSPSRPEGGEALARAYGGFCERQGAPGDCLHLLEDGPHLDDKDKRTLALSLGVNTALETRDATLRSMFSTTQLCTTLGLALATYLALLVAPEPVSKGLAASFGVMLWIYLGAELFTLVNAYLELGEEAAAATTFAQLREAGERFGRVLGPNSVRILVMLGTATLGETATLLSRVSTLPGFIQATRQAESHGILLGEAVLVADGVHISGVASTFSVVLPATALSMSARGSLMSAFQKANKPQVHHIATVENTRSTAQGGPWTPRFKEIFDKARMSMEDAANKVSLPGHRGPHPAKYHANVYRRLADATAKCQSTLQCRDALVAELQKLARELSTKTSEIYKLLTE